MESFDLKARYLDLLKKSLMHELYVEYDLRIHYLLACIRGEEKFEEPTLREVAKYWPRKFEELSKYVHDGFPPWGKVHNLGYSHTMIGRARLDNLQSCIESVHQDDVPGDLVECGVWRGGAVVFMRAMLAVLGDGERSVWVADSFQGIPRPSAEPDVAFGADLSSAVLPMLSIDQGTVEDTFRLYDLLDERVRFLPGWFRDTLVSAPIERVSVLRLDGDTYESTMDALTAFYDRLSPGGFLIVDDYHFMPTCRQAVQEFRESRGVTEPLERIDWAGAYWRRAR